MSSSETTQVLSTEQEGGSASKGPTAAYTEVIQSANEKAVRSFSGGRTSVPSPRAYEEDSQEADAAAVRTLSPAGAGAPEPALTGHGFTYRHDWGRRRGQQTLRLNWGAINSRSRVLVSIAEGAAGGADNGKFIGAARYTLHNVAPRAGGVDIWVNIEWGADISIYVDYMVVNP